MCERTCPKCGSSEHFSQYGLMGVTITCECNAILAVRFDEAAAPLDCDDPEAYARARTGVRPGAEARDPSDDEFFQGTQAFA